MFAIPGIAVGTYSVTITLPGFKTAVLSDVRIVTGTPASIKAVLEIGALNETVEVSSRAELVQTQTAAVVVDTHRRAAERSAAQLAQRALRRDDAARRAVRSGRRPARGRHQRPAEQHHQHHRRRRQTGNMLQSGDGFFSMVTPRLDAVEEITVTGAVPGAGAGPGSVQIQFATRSGTNRLDGSAYHYWRQPEFNSNYYFNKVNNLEKNEVVAHQYGFRQGGPIVHPGPLRRP